VEFRILGPLEVIGADGPVVLRGAKRRGLLAFLLVHRGQVLSSDRLVDALGDGGVATGTTGTVQTYLSQLRKLLPQLGGQLVTQPSGYLLALPDDALDAARFEAMVRTAATERDSGSRLRLLDGALGLWRGSALEEFSWPWAVAERARLDRRRLDALCSRADVRLQRGEYLDALSELDALTDEYPLDERLCGQRMLAAYRAGRRTEALHAFQQLRHSLANELGLDPGPDLVELERRMLDHDPALRTAAQPATPDLGSGRDATVVPAFEAPPEREDARRDLRASSFELGLATVAVLITDLVGSASLRTTLGDHRADEVERWHERILTDAVNDYHGTIVKRLGDGAMAIFSTSTDAIAAAAAIQTRLAREVRAHEASVRVRIGISAGEVVIEAHDDVRGLPPTEAARLCARAEGGQILASQLVEDLATARSAATFVPIGAYELKGLPGPTPVYEVPWPIGADESLPIPEALQGTGDELRFVGRATELAALEDSWRAARTASAFHALLVTGEAGAGKSRLVTELAAVSAPSTRAMLFGRCDEVAGYPFQPVAEWLRHYLAHASAPCVGMVRARHGPQLSRLVPELIGGAAGVDHANLTGETGDPFPLYEAVVGWLTLIADSGPVLLVVDDLQWASRPTLALLRHLVQSAPRIPALLVATCRDDDVPEARLASLLGRLDRAGPVRHVALSGLDVDDVAAMVAEVRGGTSEGPLEAVAKSIHDETSGNPLFVTALARELESLASRGPGASGQTRPPQRVMELVVSRLATLEPATVELLQKAAVTGIEFEFSLLRLVAGDPDDAMLDRLAEAVEARYLVELPGTPLRYRFTHGVVRNALLETVPVSQRMRLHRLAGRGLEQLGRAGDDRMLSALAHHYSEAAALGEGNRAINYCRLAADVATQQLAHDEAATWLERALTVADTTAVSEHLRYELLLALGRAQVCAGHEGARRSLFRAYALARDRGDAIHAAEALLSLNRGFFARTGETDREAVTALEATLELFAPGEESGMRAALLAALASELVWADAGDRRFELSDRALAMARRLADPRTVARVLVLRNMTILAPDTVGERTANCYELLGLAEELQDDTLRFDAAFHRGGTALEAGDAEAAHEMVELAARVAGRLRQPRFLWQARLMQTAQAVFRGALEDAGFFAREALGLGRRAGQATDAVMFHAEQMLEIHRWQGRLREHLDELMALAGRPGWDLGYALTRYLYEAGETGAALDVYRRVVNAGFLPVRRDMLATPSLYNLAFLATRAGDREASAALYDALAPFAESFANTTVAKPVGWHFLGMLAGATGRVEQARAHLEKAIGIHDLVGAPLFRAESQIELARLELDEDNDDDALELLASARAAAEARGADALVASIAEFGR
jgi:DNA-binding SARP family transcriptional activator/class 3 adenylate cyclase